jgi:tetratricopeptide (TPR) repeat protein
MPVFRFPSDRRRLAPLVLALAALGVEPACAAVEAPAAAASSPVRNSPLDARLFYQLLLGELELRQGQAGNAYQLILEAARRTRDEALFRRATDIALHARAGDQALAAATAWRQALPDSHDAMRYQVQLYLALNRVAETEEPLSAMLKQTPRPALPALIDAMPRLLARSADRHAAATVIERTLRPYAEAPETRASALTATARGWLAAGDTNKALELARAASAADPMAEGPAFLALDMLPGTPAAEAIVTAHLTSKPASPNVRLFYVRTLAAAQRLGDASAQLAVLTQSDPNLAPPWLTLGALELELRRPKEATAALENYVRLIESGAPVTMGAAAVPQGSSAEDDDDSPSSTSAALTQAWLLLAQAAEQQQDFAGAERWLARIDNPRRALEVQARRASLLARQGRVPEARELIRRAPEQSPGDARAKLLAETEILRERKMWAEATEVLAQASRTFPNDTELLYEEAMLHEKLDRVDDMERLLRRVIELKPDHQHAYNALGYSLADRKLRLDEARTLIQKALELSPGEPSITDSLGWVEYRLGNHEEAIRHLRRAYQARPDPEIAAHLGEVLWASGQREEARKVWREAHSRDSQNDVLRETLARLRVDL